MNLFKYVAGLLICLIAFSSYAQDDQTLDDQILDWSLKHFELTNRIDYNEDQPPVSCKDLDLYLHWMGIQAIDRDEVGAIFDEIHRLAQSDLDHKTLADIYKDYEYLFYSAEHAGDGTVNMACMRFMNIKDEYDKWGYWDTAWRSLNRNGRRIYNRAVETQFSTHCTKERARCMLNFAIKDIETNDYIFGMYRDRSYNFGYLDDAGYAMTPNRDFVVVCEPRTESYMVSEGEPWAPMSEAFENVELLREEADWWNYPVQYQDATDLMNQYNRDALCKKRPNRGRLGHRHFVELAKQYELDESVEYNEGFYGTLYGKVEILDGEEYLPASGAKVTIQEFDQIWEVTTDENGYYEIPDAILHKECGPFQLVAEHDGDWVNATYDGILEEPDRTARLKKDLLIVRQREYTWRGKAELLHSETLNCTKGDGSFHTIRKQESKLQNVRLNLKVKGDALLEGNLAMLSEENMKAAGAVDVLMHYEDWLTSDSENSYIREHTRQVGQDIFKIDESDLIIQIFKERDVDPEVMGAKLQEVMQKGLENPEAMDEMMEELEAMMSGGNKKEFPVRVVIRLNQAEMSKVENYYYRETGGSGHEPNVNEETKTMDMIINPTLAWLLEGTYFKDDEGLDRIVATLDEILPNESGDKDCQPNGSYTNSWSFELKRIREK
ncbi:MAG: carboxypeptidase regulatory-like domain-containing protein [Bacteroidetes bacterium]|nr:carboxypeptidase regulatory-like domain-containing protein [Bacteroidota bacterium]